MRRPSIRQFIRLVTLTISPLAGPWAQGVESLVYHAHTPDEHGGGAITHEIVEDRENNLFFANEAGLLKFDGEHWSRMPATGQAGYIISVVIDAQDRIWISSTQSIGYYSTDHSGSYNYTDITESLIGLTDDAGFGPFWKLYAHGRYIYLITTSYVLRWDGHHWEHWHFEVNQRLLPNWLDNTLYIHARGVGFFRLSEGRFDLIANETSDVSSGIISILESADDGLLCVTVTNGLFQLKDGEFHSRDLPIAPPIVYYALQIEDGSILLSKGNDGILIINSKGEATGNVSHKNTPAYCIFEDNSGVIWVGTTRAILEIPQRSISSYSDNAQDIVRHNNSVYYTNGSELKVIDENSSANGTQVLRSAAGLWDLHSTENGLLYGGSKLFGVYQNGGSKLEIPYPRHIVNLFSSEQNPDIVYFSDTPTISRWKNAGSGWQYLDSHHEFNSRALSLIELPNSQLLVASENRPLLLVSWPSGHSDRGTSTITPLTAAHGLPDKFMWAHCLRIDQTVIVISNKGLFRYDNSTETFEYDPVLGDDLGTDAYGLESCPAADNIGWVLRLPTHETNGNPIGLLSIGTDNQFEWTPWQLPSVHLTGKVEALLHEKIDGVETLWVGGSKDLLRYDLTRMSKPSAPRTRITGIDEQVTNQTYFGGAGEAPASYVWPYPQNTLRLRFAARPAPIIVNGYQTRLVGFTDAWSESSQSTFREFTNLSEGDYTFEVRAVDEFGRAGESATLSFTILPPWYRTSSAYAAYFAIAAAALIGTGKVNRSRLRLKNERLEALINERTFQLEEQKLQLIRANQAKQNFLASMSHEIRNPLNGIIGIARLLREKASKEGQPSEEIQHLYACSTHLHQLLGQTLDYSSLEAGKLRTRMESFDLSTLLDEVLQIQNEMAQKKGIELILNKPKITFQTIGDPVLLRQILINLVSNGIKYTPAGSVTVSVSIEEKADSVQACFEVVDTGPGIPKDQQTRIFEEFARLPESEASQIPGTGLGLTISAEMARLMGGRLILDGDYQAGARFLLDLEFGIELSPTKRESAKEREAPRALAGKKVLIADDMDFNRYISAAVLGSMGAEIDQAENGLIALHKLQSVTYDIVILDISMPQMSGPEVVEAYLQNHTRSCPEFIALSAYNNPEAEADCIAAGFDHFLEKPLDPEKLKELLHHHGRSQSAEAPDLLSYLSANGKVNFQELRTEYIKAFKEQLVQLKAARFQENHKAQAEVIHKLLGLCRVGNNEAISAIVETIAARSKQEAPGDEIDTLIDQLSAEIDQAAE